MHVTDLPINQALGMRLASGECTHLLEMPQTPLALNHIGTVHASAQFALAEAASGEFLIQGLSDGGEQPFAVLRTSSVKFRKPAHGHLRGLARFASGSVETLRAELQARSRALVTVVVEVLDENGVTTMSGEFDWFIQQQTKASVGSG
jgi:acyl-coenzyme A thioesterase PaaI-like protein